MSASSLGRSDLIEKAASLVQRGDLKGAIPRYAKLFQDNPADWNVANTLGDLYVRVGRSDDAVAHFGTLAEQLAADGFTAKARALYRKILRLKPDNEIAMRRVAELDRSGATLSPFVSRLLETARSARQNHPAGPPAAGPEIEIAPAPERAAPEPDVVADASEARGPAGQASPPIDVWTPHVPVPVVEAPAADAPIARVQPAVAAAAPAREPHAPVEPPAGAPVTVPEAAAAAPRAPRPVDEFSSAEAAADVALARQDFAQATAIVERFLARHPGHVRALEKLIDIGVDGGLDSDLPWVQVRLAEACLDAERFQQAQNIALDLICREPGTARHQDLLERVIAAARDRGQTLRPICRPAPEPEETPVVVAPRAEPPVAAPPPPRDVAVPSPPVVEPPPPAPPAEAPVIVEPPAAADVADLPPDLAEWSDPDRAFDELRMILLEEAAAAAEERFAEGVRLIDGGQTDQAIRALEEAMCAPHLRTPAGARLAGIYRDLGAPIEALACLEWVAEMPPASEESGHELAYQLALTLEALGQQAQAMGVYRELLAEVGPAYRDVAVRAERLGAA